MINAEMQRGMIKREGMIIDRFYRELKNHDARLAPLQQKVR